MRFASLGLLLLTLSSCSKDSEGAGGDHMTATDVGDALDERAIERGILPDLNNLVFAGRFETRSELGTDKFCAVDNGSGTYKIGVLAVFGPESKCEGQGSAKIEGEKVQITLAGKGNCSFDAEYDGVELRFPGGVGEECESYCTSRASLSGTSYFMVEEGDDGARRALGRDIERLCD
ncbi:hypothetical protein ACFOWX_05795 [Sphingorhabdus arenilitoris]|uniref:Lipoprotein n=1 Tax=Sphingorhabdus arenilitoris TaxID=1490041 RepID=A0ABV8RHE6_9SPHN